VADRSHRLAPGERTSVPTRELAQRLSGGDEVLLLWHPDSDRVELSVRNLASGVDRQIEVAPADALDAFRHPFAYAGMVERPHRVDLEEMTIDDG
jgi:hypothetical protein